MDSIKKEILELMQNLYGEENVEFYNGKIYVDDEDNNSGYEITVETTT